MMNHPIPALSQAILQAFAPVKLEDVWRIAKAISGSDLAPKDYRDKPDNVIVAIMMGAEVGLSPMAAIQNIAVINGRPSLWGDAALAVVRVHPEFESIAEGYDEAKVTAVCTIKRRGQEAVTRSFSRVDAEKAKLWEKDGPWKQYSRRMLQMRARSWAMRDSFPDALRGLHVAEEAADIPKDITPEKDVETTHKLGMAGLKSALEANGGSLRVKLVQPDDQPRVTYAQLVDTMYGAADMDVLHASADLIRTLPEAQQIEATAIYMQCEREMREKELAAIKLAPEGGQA